MRSFFYTLVLLSPVFASTVGSVVTETYQLDSRFAGATFLDNFDFFTVSQSRRLKSPQPSTRYPNTFPSQIRRQTNAPVGTRPNKRLCKVRLPCFTLLSLFLTQLSYVTSSYASTWGLTRQLADGSVYIGVDYENILVPYGIGRDSVRISSTKSWGTGTLVVVDLAHMPGGQCGTLPAMWMLGPNWPYGGEIDIIEGVNSNVVNLMSLHTYVLWDEG
jgi:hypothetical protein